MPSIYEQIGGEAAVDAAVEIFYKKIMTDETLSPFFDGVRMPRQIYKQKAFLTMAFGGPSKYEGKDLREAHKHLVEDQGLNESHFNSVAGHLQATLEELNVPSDLISQIMEIAGSTKKDVLNQ